MQRRFVAWGIILGQALLALKFLFFASSLQEQKGEPLGFCVAETCQTWYEEGGGG